MDFEVTDTVVESCTWFYIGEIIGEYVRFFEGNDKHGVSFGFGVRHDAVSCFDSDWLWRVDIFIKEEI